MTMKTDAKTIPAGEFKARCLALLDRVSRTRETIIVTKRGRPVARLAPVEADLPLSMEGSVSYGGDIVGPSGEDWDAER
jgi:prevent-host-death family protein